MQSLFELPSCLVIVLVAGKDDDPPRWPDKYMVCGVLQLPYAEIEEPFCGYWDSKANMSRVDYYPGKLYLN